MAGKVVAFARRRVQAKVSQVGPRFLGKLVRHAPSGKVAFCVGAGHCEHKRWGVFKSLLAVQVVTCPSCAGAVKQLGYIGVMMASGSGHLANWPVSEVVGAMESEARKFIAAMKGEA